MIQEVGNNLVFSLNATMPIFFMMVVGWVLKKTGFLDDNTTNKINQLVFKFFLPALLFMDLAKEDFLTVWNGKLVGFCFLATVVSIILAAVLSLFNKNREERGEFIQAAFRSGAATLGIAFMQNIYNDTTMVALMIIGSVPLYNIMSVLILSFTANNAETKKTGKSRLISALRNVVTNPIILGIAAGLLWSLLQLPQPVMLTKTMTYLGNLASPLALIALGASFEFSQAKEKIGVTGAITGIKLILFCLLFLPLAIVMGFRNEALVAILIMLGSATTSSCFIMAKNMGHKGIVSSCAVMSTTLFSSFTLSLWLFILKSRGYI